jgi:hypothetical protein
MTHHIGRQNSHFVLKNHSIADIIAVRLNVQRYTIEGS